jgi:hypothetical protein
MIRLYKWIKKYQFVARVNNNKKNLWRTCKRRKIARPSSMTEEEVNEKIKEYQMKLKSLEEDQNLEKSICHQACQLPGRIKRKQQFKPSQK